MPLAPRTDPASNVNPLSKHPSLQSLDESYRERTSSHVKSSFSAASSNLGLSRLGSASPASTEAGPQIFSKRTREIQAAEGLISGNAWGAIGSPGSSPAPEPTTENSLLEDFPDFVPSANSPFSDGHQPRARAGTLPSRLISLTGNGVTTPMTLSSRPTPSASPFPKLMRQDHDLIQDSKFLSPLTSTILSRYRAGSTPQRLGFYTGPSTFSAHPSVWTPSRDRPTLWQSPHQGEGLSNHIPAVTPEKRHLLAETSGSLHETETGESVSSLPPHLANLSLQLNPNRFRSYSVNAKAKYDEEESGYIDEDDRATNQQSLYTESVGFGGMGSQSRAQVTSRDIPLIDHYIKATRPRAQTIGVVGIPRQVDGRGSALEDLSDQSHYNPETGVETSAARYATDIAVETLRQVYSIAPDSGSRPDSSRSLWLGNVPLAITVASLEQLFVRFGHIESIRLLPTKSCCFVNYHSVESAVRAKTALTGVELFPGHGIARIGFAKSPSSNFLENGFGSDSLDHPQMGVTTSEGYLRKIKPLNVAMQFPQGSGNYGHARVEVQNEGPDPDRFRETLLSLGASESEASAHLKVVLRDQQSIPLSVTEIGPAPESSHARIFDAPQLREIRKRLDNGTILPAEIEELALKMLPELAELASDYLGNTIVQKLFELCEESTKGLMLARIGPHLAEIGIHKNGTWAAQKIIERTSAEPQIALIVDSLSPYTVPLFLDQYGNYVLQCCLRFGPPATDFLFECIVTRLWTLAQARFGARAVRACLESQFASDVQLRSVAAAIVLSAAQLASNPNSALLLTWYVDSYNLPHRRVILASRLAPEIIGLCTHKFGHLIILKLLSQRAEPEAWKILIRAIFYDNEPHALNRILSDQACGLSLISKVVTAPFLENSIRDELAGKVRIALQSLNLSSLPSYKRLAQELRCDYTMTIPADFDTGISGASTSERTPQSVQRNDSSQFAFPLHQRQFRTNVNFSAPSEAHFSNTKVELPNHPSYSRDLASTATLQYRNRPIEQSRPEYRSPSSPRTYSTGNQRKRSNQQYQPH